MSGGSEETRGHPSALCEEQQDALQGLGLNAVTEGVAESCLGV